MRMWAGYEEAPVRYGGRLRHLDGRGPYRRLLRPARIGVGSFGPLYAEGPATPPVGRPKTRCLEWSEAAPPHQGRARDRAGCRPQRTGRPTAPTPSRPAHGRLPRKPRIT
ncbi:hypothetical protein GCM10018791_09190 [Streptomyces zaomyceticus]|nr:hypothetical protein GCM10018791_09190 [Streptomyces zaomyceticus]